MIDEAGRVEMHVHVDGACRDHQAFAITHRRAGADDQARVDAVHHRRIARLADADDLAVLHAEVALHDPDDGIDDGRVAKEKVERALGIGQTGRHAEPVAQGLAAAVQAFVAIDGIVLLDDGDERRVGETDAVADGRAVESGIFRARYFGHDRSLTRP